jgi:hypothetical protein
VALRKMNRRQLNASCKVQPNAGSRTARTSRLPYVTCCGENFEWCGTPLYVLYTKHIVLGKTRDLAIEEAAKDLGWLVKSVFIADKRTFRVGKAGQVRSCEWVGNERGIDIGITATVSRCVTTWDKPSG